MILILLSLAIILTYVGVMVKRNGIPDSISDTFYTLKHKLWFLFTMVFTSGLLMPKIISMTPESYQFTAFLACVGMIIVGTAPNFKEGIEKKIHISGAILCILFSQIWISIICPYILSIWLIYLIYTVISLKKNWNGKLIDSFILTKPTFWIEVSTLITTYTTILLHA